MLKLSSDGARGLRPETRRCDPFLSHAGAITLAVHVRRLSGWTAAVDGPMMASGRLEPTGWHAPT